MSVYKEPLQWIKQAIDSILSQTFKDFEFIIVNDNPSSSELKQYLINVENSDDRVIVVTNKENIGLTKSLNIGLNKTNGRYIARMDADDISLPTRFEKQVKFMELNPDVIVCGTNIKLIGNYKPFYIKPIFFNNIDIRGQMFHNSGFVHPSVFIRRSVLDLYKISYDESYKSAQDYKLWYDLRDKGLFANLKEKLLSYRISNIQVTSILSSNQKTNRKIISDLFKQDWLNSLNTAAFQINHKFPKNMNARILSSYYLRSEAYKHPSFRNLMSTALSINLKLSIKERLSLSCKAFIQILKKLTHKPYL